MAGAIRHSFPRPGETAWLRVEGAAARTVITLNGAEIHRQLGGWVPFEVDLTPHLSDHNTLEIDSGPAPLDEYPFAGFLPAIGTEVAGISSFRILDEPAPAMRPAPSRARAEGRTLLVDDRPFAVRGVLHWGVYPEHRTPWPNEETMRAELEAVRSRGFNLVKFCLWIPPHRFYELCEEFGLLVWQEYPAWNAPIADERWIGEYERFFANDAPYSCVILRTLTCENDRFDPELAARIIARGRAMIPGALFLDNSSWLCAEHHGDFHDEHLYLHALQWPFQRQRIGSRLAKPLIFGETIAVDSVDARSHRLAVEVRRGQIEQIEEQFPGAGYVITAIRDLDTAPLGILDRDGRPKSSVEEWRWHGHPPEREPRAIPPLTGPVIGPRKGEWKCHENPFWSPVIEVLDESLPREHIEEEAMFALFTGRVLEPCEEARTLVRLRDVHSGSPKLHPLVLECASGGARRIISAFRSDTAAGRELARALAERRTAAPEIGPLRGDAIVLEEWRMTADDGGGEIAVRCDTPFVNGGRNVFYGWATFRTTVDLPGGRWLLVCEAVGDFYEISIDGEVFAEAGNRTGTWDGTRDIPRTFPIERARGRGELVFRVRDWRGAGGMVGPVYLTQHPEQRVF